MNILFIYSLSFIAGIFFQNQAKAQSNSLSLQEKTKQQALIAERLAAKRASRTSKVYDHAKGAWVTFTPGTEGRAATKPLTARKKPSAQTDVPEVPLITNEPITRAGTPQTRPASRQDLTEIHEKTTVKHIPPHKPTIEDIIAEGNEVALKREEQFEREKANQQALFEARIAQKREQIKRRNEIREAAHAQIQQDLKEEVTYKRQPKTLPTQHDFHKAPSIIESVNNEIMQEHEHIKWSENLSLYGLRKHLKKCPDLISLTCENIPKGALKVIGECCPKLKIIDLSGCTDLNEDDFYDLVNGCKGLEQINISYCTQVDNGCMREIANASMLKNLTMQGCTQVLDLGFMALKKLRNLEILDLTHCTQVTDQDLIIIKELKLPRFKRIIITGCTNISEKTKNNFRDNNIEIID